MIDSHVHFWKYNKIKDAWITDDMKLLQKDFLPQNLQPILEENNVSGVVAVQADQSEDETQFLLSLAKGNDFIKGVVGWVDLQNEDLEKKLLYYSNETLIKGFRHIVQAEAPGFFENEKFLDGVRALQDFGFTYDILIYERQLNEALKFVNKFPSAKFIIDHCAKPDIKNESIVEWKNGIKEMSENKNVYCKLSGLITEANWNDWNENTIYPYLDVVFDCFEINRLVFGSDWPVMLLSGTYSKWKRFLENYMKHFTKQEKEKIFSENAARFYNLSL